jgi:predicted small lipoprotein YifL
MKKLTFVFLISLLGISAGISGCGQKGSLYIPVSEEVATKDVAAEVTEDAQENEEANDASTSTD